MQRISLPCLQQRLTSFKAVCQPHCYSICMGAATLARPKSVLLHRQSTLQQLGTARDNKARSLLPRAGKTAASSSGEVQPDDALATASSATMQPVVQQGSRAEAAEDSALKLGEDEMAEIGPLLCALVTAEPSLMKAQDAAVMTKMYGLNWEDFCTTSNGESRELAAKLAPDESARLPAIQGTLNRLFASVMAVGTYGDHLEQRLATRERRATKRRALLRPQLDVAEAEGEAEQADLGHLNEVDLDEDSEKVQLSGAVKSSREFSDATARATSAGSSGNDERATEGDAVPRESDTEAARQAAMEAAKLVLPAELRQYVGVFMDLYRKYTEGEGWAEDAEEQDSSEMVGIQRLHAELQQLADVTDDSFPDDASIQEFVQRLEALAEEVSLLVAAEPNLTDPAARAVACYIGSQLLGADGQDGEDNLMGPAEPAVAFQCTPEVVGRLGRFIRAAKSWELYRRLIDAYGACHPELKEQIRQGTLYDMGVGPDWWLRPVASLSQQELRAALWRPGMLLADEEKIEALSELPELELRFMLELVESDYSPNVLIKWSLHPQVGPRIMSGQLSPASIQQGAGFPVAPGSGSGTEAGDDPGPISEPIGMDATTSSAFQAAMQQVMAGAWADAQAGNTRRD